MSKRIAPNPKKPSGYDFKIRREEKKKQEEKDAAHMKQFMVKGMHDLFVINIEK